MIATTKSAASTRNWNVSLTLRLEAGYGNEKFLRSPVLGSNNVRVRPADPKSAFLTYLMTAEAGRAQCMEIGLTDEDLKDRKKVQALLDEATLDNLFATYFGTLDGGAGLYDQPPSRVLGWSFRIPTGLQGHIYGATAPQPSQVTPTSTTDALRAKIAAMKAAREEEAKKAEQAARAEQARLAAPAPEEEQQVLTAPAQAVPEVAEEQDDAPAATEQPTPRRRGK